MLEHHWLNPAALACNPSIVGGTYNGCEPCFFNHGWESVPVALFYDSHVEGIGVREAEKADSRVRAQTSDLNGLWSQDTKYGDDGYFIDYGYDFAATSFHSSRPPASGTGQDADGGIRAAHRAGPSRAGGRLRLTICHFHNVESRLLRRTS
jgi:hypothetical protein